MSIKSDCKRVFLLESIEFDILSIIGKSGEILRKDVLLASLSPKQTIRKIEHLAKNGFLRETKSEPYRNMKNKKIKTFGLTLKGLIASFAKTNPRNNYWIKKYLEYIEDPKIKKSMLDYIESDIELFLLTNKNMGIKIQGMKDIELWLKDYRYLDKFLKKDPDLVKQIAMKMDVAEKNLISTRVPFENILEYLLIANYDKWYEIIKLFLKEKSIIKITNELEKMNKISSDREFNNIGIGQFTDETTNKKIMYELFRGWKNNTKQETKSTSNLE